MTTLPLSCRLPPTTHNDTVERLCESQGKARFGIVMRTTRPDQSYRFGLLENMPAHFWWGHVTDRKASSLAPASLSTSGNKCPWWS